MRPAPLSSEKDWYLVAAWALVVVYLYMALFHPKAPFGLFLLPLALGLIATATFLAPDTPLAREPASKVWGAIHGISIMLAAVSVLVGFVAGLMYLGQVWHLKHKILPTRGLRLPSLEWLQRANSRAMVASVLMLGVGVLAGMVLNLINLRNEADYLPWTDPVILGTWLMFFWLLVAVVLGAVYPSARKGHKVAYLTVASFVFLVIVLITGLLTESRHWGRGARGVGREVKVDDRMQIEICKWEIANCRMQITNCKLQVGPREEQFSIFNFQFSIVAVSPASTSTLPLPSALPRRPAMLVQVVGCSHHGTSIAVRERLAFTPEQTREALDHWRRVFPRRRGRAACPPATAWKSTPPRSMTPSRRFDQIAEFLARFHGLDPADVIEHLYQHSDEAAVQHLFTVASSLDSMVLGEPQILAQVKAGLSGGHRAGQHRAADARGVSGGAARGPAGGQRNGHPSAPREHSQRGRGRFRPANLRTLRRQGGAGDRGRRNGRRNAALPAGRRGLAGDGRQPAASTGPINLAQQWNGRAVPWDELPKALAAADLVISTTAAGEPIVTLEQFAAVEAQRFERPLFILDLAVPRDFEPAIGNRPDVYLYSIDDLQAACQRNRAKRDKELPAAMHIIEQETARFMAEMYHRAVGPVIERLRHGWQKPKDEELQRLLNKAARAGRSRRRTKSAVRSTGW